MYCNVASVKSKTTLLDILTLISLPRADILNKVRKKANIRNRYNQVQKPDPGHRMGK